VDTGTSNRGTAGGPGDNGSPAQRLAPRSPRAALQPENVPQPKRPSRHARHPLVIIGNAIFTIILVIGIAGGLAYSFGKHRFETQGPLERDKIVNIPRGLGVREIADRAGCSSAAC
jgi:peptidoglycan lytic transglycosylase G